MGGESALLGKFVAAASHVNLPCQSEHYAASMSCSIIAFFSNKNYNVDAMPVMQTEIRGTLWLNNINGC